jgi:feruloyl esterase
MPIPLARGYATFGSDSGHTGSSADGSFATNREALQNYALDAVKKTRDAAVFLIAARYGRPAARLYFHGSSNGGKEAFGMIQRYPADLDGAMIFWPAVHIGSEAVQFARVARALEAPGAWLDLAKRQRLHAAELEACDGLDGVRDGVISNPRACEARFDPASATLGGEKLRCPDGRDTSDRCLSDAQIAFLKALDTPARPDFKLPHAGGLAAYNAWSADIGFSADDAFGKGLTAQGLGTLAPAFPRQPGMPFLSIFSDHYAKYFLTGDPAARWSAIDPEHPGAWRARLVELAALLDHADPDLSAFRAHGGKILLLHGTADQILPTRGTEIYYDGIVRAMGRRTVESFLRFYELPGAAHSGWGSTFNPAWDGLGALDAWASTGRAPASPVVTGTYAVPGRTRPLCEYPLWPKYKGHGDINQAANFVCTGE